MTKFKKTAVEILELLQGDCFVDNLAEQLEDADNLQLETIDVRIVVEAVVPKKTATLTTWTKYGPKLEND